MLKAKNNLEERNVSTPIKRVTIQTRVDTKQLDFIYIVSVCFVLFVLQNIIIRVLLGSDTVRVVERGLRCISFLYHMLNISAYRWRILFVSFLFQVLNSLAMAILYFMVVFSEYPYKNSKEYILVDRKQ